MGTELVLKAALLPLPSWLLPDASCGLGSESAGLSLSGLVLVLSFSSMFWGFLAVMSPDVTITFAEVQEQPWPGEDPTLLPLEVCVEL